MKESFYLEVGGLFAFKYILKVKINFLGLAEWL